MTQHTHTLPQTVFAVLITLATIRRLPGVLTYCCWAAAFAMCGYSNADDLMAAKRIAVCALAGLAGLLAWMPLVKMAHANTRASWFIYRQRVYLVGLMRR